jgi:hypothetical protein
MFVVLFYDCRIQSEEQNTRNGKVLSWRDNYGVKNAIIVKAIVFFSGLVRVIFFYFFFFKFFFSAMRIFINLIFFFRKKIFVWRWKTSVFF